MATTEKQTRAKREGTGGTTGRHNGTKTAVAIAGAAAALAAAAAGYYFYASKDAAKNRRKAAKWAGDFKEEVMDQMERINSIDRDAVTKAIDRAATIYKSARTVDVLELARAAQELKAHWRDLASEYGASTASTTRARTRSKRATKKVAGGGAAKRAAKKKTS